MISSNKIIISTTLFRPEEIQIKAALLRRGFNVDVCLTRQGISWEKLMANLPAIVLMRNLSHREALNNSAMYTAAGPLVINSHASIQICTNKVLQSVELQRVNVPIIDYRVAFNSDDIRNAVETLGYPFVIKPISASWGRGIARILNSEALETWFAARESVDASEKSYPLLVQRYIEKSDFDIRVVVIGDIPVVAFKRNSAHWKTNTHLNGKVEPIAITDEFKEIAKNVTRKIGKGFYGIDLIEDPNTGKIFFCEVNHNPEFAKSSAIHGVDIAECIADYVYEIAVEGIQSTKSEIRPSLALV